NLTPFPRRALRGDPNWTPQTLGYRRGLGQHCQRDHLRGLAAETARLDQLVDLQRTLLGTEVLHAADVAVAPVAVERLNLVEGAVPLLAQVGGGDTAVDVFPGQLLPHVALAVGVPGGGQAAIGERPLPGAPAMVLAPSVELRPQLPGTIHGARQPPVAARQHRLQGGFVRVVPGQLDAGAAGRLLQDAVARLQLLRCHLREPLEGRVRLWDEVGGGDAHTRAIADVPPPDRF